MPRPTAVEPPDIARMRILVTCRVRRVRRVRRARHLSRRERARGGAGPTARAKVCRAPTGRFDPRTRSTSPSRPLQSSSSQASLSWLFGFGLMSGSDRGELLGGTSFLFDSNSSSRLSRLDPVQRTAASATATTQPGTAIHGATAATVSPSVGNAFPTRQMRRTRTSVPATFAAATRPAWSPPPPATSIVLAVGEAATAASHSELERDGRRSGRPRSPRTWRPADITVGPAARPSKKCNGSAAHSRVTEAMR
jgi:hypothetical protein